MDLNYQTGNLPVGLPMSVVMNEQTRAGFERLSEAEKEHLILKCKDAKSEEEVDQILSSLNPTEDLGDLFQGPSIG